MVKLSLCLIVKPSDEEAPLLDRCLEVIHKWVDEVCITITGKNKKVEEVAKKYKARISYFKWENDFAKARNFNFSQAKGKYILWLDSDDLLKGAENLPEIIERMEKEEIDVGIVNYLYDFDEFGICIVKHRKARIIRNDGCVKWVGRLHEDLIDQRKVNACLIKGIEVLHLTNPKRIQRAKERNLEIAIEIFKENQDDPRNWWLVANAYMALGENQKAIEYFLGFIPKSGSEIEVLTAYQRLASCYLGLGEYQRALECAFKVIEMKPWFPDGYLSAGEIFYRQGKFKHAREFLSVGLSKEVPEDEYIVWNPRDYDFNPLMMLAQTYIELAKPKEAKTCLEGCLKIYPNHPKAKILLEAVEKTIKETEKVDEIFEKAQKIKDKKELKKLLDDVPVELKSHPKLVYLRNINFIKRESSGKDLVIYCFHTAEPFNPEIVQKLGRGGSEEAVCQMAKRLAKLGWKVEVYANTGLNYPTELEGVIWKPFWEFNVRDKQDILIVWRHPLLFDFEEVNAKKKYVWLHDVLEAKEFTPKRLERITKIFALSKYQRNLFPDIPDEKFLITGNGIEPEVFPKNIKREYNRLIYTSSYDRGLETLLKLFPYIKKEIPEAELHIFYGWQVWDTMYQGNPEMMARKERIIQLMKQPGVFEHGRVSQEQILKEYAKSSIWAYPTEFQEISCISGMKAQALGAIPVTTNVAALDETIQFGTKIDCSNIYSDKEGQAEFIEVIIKLLKNPPPEKEREEMMKWARRKFHWDRVVKHWNKEFKS